jgi:hypothetical protein
VSASGAATPGSSATNRRSPVTASRCQATTKKGTQCSRKAQAARSYCWQH